MLEAFNIQQKILKNTNRIIITDDIGQQLTDDIVRTERLAIQDGGSPQESRAWVEVKVGTRGRAQLVPPSRRCLRRRVDPGPGDVADLRAHRLLLIDVEYQRPGVGRGGGDDERREEENGGGRVEAGQCHVDGGPDW